MIGLLKRALDEEIAAGGLSDALRRYANDVSSDDVEHLATVLEQFLRAVPDALAWALAVSQDPRCGRSFQHRETAPPAPSSVLRSG